LFFFSYTTKKYRAQKKPTQVPAESGNDRLNLTACVPKEILSPHPKKKKKKKKTIKKKKKKIKKKFKKKKTQKK